MEAKGSKSRHGTVRTAPGGAFTDGPEDRVPSGTLLSISLRMPQEVPGGFFGHEVDYQRALVAVAEQRVSRAVVIVPGSTNADIPGVVSLESERDTGSWVGSLQEFLDNHADDDTTVLVYEGGQQSLASVVWLAASNPNIIFVMNLYELDRELSFPNLSERSPMDGRYLDSVIDRSESLWMVSSTKGPGLPPNLVLYADTARRAVLARGLGLKNVRVWPLYSVLRPIDRRPRTERLGKCSVVVPVAGRQVTRQLAYEIATVVQLCQRYDSSGQNFDWYVFGTGYGGGLRRRTRRRLMARLEGFGVRFEPNGLSGEDYARALADADVVWLPKRGLYTTKSSGKAADALVSATPVLAPNGSYPAQEQDRWVPGSPAYTGAREAVEIFLRSATVWPTLRAQMAEQLDQIRWWYSPERAVDEILTTAAETRERLREREDPDGCSFAREAPPSQQPVEANSRRQMTRIERIARRLTTNFRASMTEVRIRLMTLVRIR